MREEGERKTKLEEEKHEQDLELELLKIEVRTGQFKRELLEKRIKEGEEWQGKLKEYNEKREELRREAVERRDKMSDEACKVREELWKKNFRDTGTRSQRDGITK